MSRKPENQFIAGVHKYMPPEKPGFFYKVKTHNPYESGIPDCWYSGKKGDLWIEYKYLSKLPKRGDTIIVPALSELQLEWVNGRFDEGRDVRVIVGCKYGGVMFREKEWIDGMPNAEFERRMNSRQGLAACIVHQVSTLLVPN